MKTHKQYVTALAVLVFCTGCSSDAGSTAADSQTEVTTGSTPATVSTDAQTSEAVTETLPIQTEPEEPSDYFWDVYEQDGNDSSSGIIREAYSFNCGATWVALGTRNSGLYDLTVYAINRDGDVIYSVPRHAPLSQCTTNFAENVAWVRTDSTDDSCASDYLIDTEGNVVWSVAEDGYAEAERLFGVGNVDAVEVAQFGIYHHIFNGYTMVAMKVNSFDTTGTYEGILKPDGTWLLEPVKLSTTSLNYLDHSTNISFSATNCYASWNIRDEADYLKSHHFYINLFTGETIETAHNFGLMFNKSVYTDWIPVQ